MRLASIKLQTYSGSMKMISKTFTGRELKWKAFVENYINYHDIIPLQTFEDIKSQFSD